MDEGFFFDAISEENLEQCSAILKANGIDATYYAKFKTDNTVQLEGTFNISQLIAISMVLAKLQNDKEALA